jgi:hypothetical protein
MEMTPHAIMAINQNVDARERRREAGETRMRRL